MARLEAFHSNKLDSNFKSYKELASKKDGNVEVLLRQGEWSAPWPVWPREMVWITHIEDMGDKGFAVTSQSVQDCPQTPLREKDVVRGAITGDLLLAEPIDGGKASKVTRIAAVDPMGSIPTMVINMMVTENAKTVAVAKKVIEAK